MNKGIDRLGLAQVYYVAVFFSLAFIPPCGWAARFVAKKKQGALITLVSSFFFSPPFFPAANPSSHFGITSGALIA